MPDDRKKPWYKDKNVQGIATAAVGTIALVFNIELGQGEAATIVSESLAGIGLLWAFGTRVYERFNS